jgi:beta-lactamase superfamily II metal-dependent hydrolase
MAMLRLTTFPAQDGDCLLLSYGDGAAERHLLVDGGRSQTYASLRPALAAIAVAGGRLELLVLSHVDADHIEGVLKLAGDAAPPVPIDEVWFNGFDQMSQLQPMGPGQGDRFSAAIRAAKWRWNHKFGGKAICLSDDGMPQAITLDGGLQLALLSPDLDRLKTMRGAWEKWRTAKAVKQAEAERAKALAAPAGLQALGRKPMPLPLDVEALALAKEQLDDEPPNGSSIAFIAEWQGKRILLAADAHTDLLVKGVHRLSGADGGRYRLDLFKVSHHGSIGNTSREVVEAVDCHRFLLSTNGSRHGHPDPESIARILKFGSGGRKTLYFNYRQPYTTPWNQQKLRDAYDYACCFAPAATEGRLTIQV